jgi:hypothetical protein
VLRVHPARLSNTLLLPLVSLAGLTACVQSPNQADPQATVAISKTEQQLQSASKMAKLLPEDNKVLLILGQDMTSVSDYVKSGLYPSPGGVTSYLAFYKLLSGTHPAFGALGEDSDGDPLTYDVDWGSGRLNAHSAAHAFRNSTLVIGLSIAEGSGQFIWAKGELARIGKGLHDDKIRRLARFCKDIEIPVYLRIGYEFDGAWNSGYENTTNYINAFRRIVAVMRTEGVNNVAYVWQASASPIDDLIEGRHERIEDWYPGDEFVDWMGISWFLPPDEKPHQVATQRELADEVLNFARARQKPVMIAESAPQRYDLEQLTRSHSSQIWDGPPGKLKLQRSAEEIWQEWFQPYFEYIKNNVDVIRAVAYINADWDSQSKWSSPYNEGYWGDSRVQANPGISSYWLGEIEDTDFWLHGSPDINQRLGN